VESAVSFIQSDMQHIMLKNRWHFRVLVLRSDPFYSILDPSGTTLAIPAISPTTTRPLSHTPAHLRLSVISAGALRAQLSFQYSFVRKDSNLILT